MWCFAEWLDKNTPFKFVPSVPMLKGCENRIQYEKILFLSKQLEWGVSPYSTRGVFARELQIEVYWAEAPLPMLPVTVQNIIFYSVLLPFYCPFWELITEQVRYERNQTDSFHRISIKKCTSLGCRVLADFVWMCYSIVFLVFRFFTCLTTPVLFCNLKLT